MITQAWTIQPYRYLALMVLSISVAFSLSAEPYGILAGDLRPAAEGAPGEKELRKNIRFSAQVELPATIHVTSKGNGTLDLGGLKLKVFDTHNDGALYDGELLKIEFADLDEDGIREMIISGIVCYTDEQTERVVRREPLVRVYRLRETRLHEVYRNTDFKLTR